MSKVLVDRELLVRLENAYMEGMSIYGECEEIRELLARPAEVEGVEVVGYAVTWIRAGDTPEKTAFMSAADFEATGGPRFYSYREPLMTVAQHLAALSAVTAERDRLLSDNASLRGSCKALGEENKQLKRENKRQGRTIAAMDAKEA